MPFLLLSISRFVAAGLLLISVLLPWFRVPVSVRDDGHGDNDDDQHLGTGYHH